ncbi:sensor histidine kinase [Streptomyces sp. NPDC020141]|uniref:sensor histidine kinase n=1 Tax=Streptomyces sp. NPDC020141 TaxID=3365065 RepID=UPI0037A8A677
MRGRAGAFLGALFGARARTRWFHLILGGALMTPFWFVGGVLLTPVTGGSSLHFGALAPQFGAYAVGLPVAAATGLLPMAGTLSAAAARALCGLPDGALAERPSYTRAARLRTAAWFALHTGIGAVISGATLALPPFALSVMAAPFSPALREWLRLPEPPLWLLALFPLAGVAMLLALAGWAAAAGWGLARLAPVLLGPTPADRLADAERRAAELAERNRLARELHDSVGHALSAVTLQAGAARRVLETDPGFVREALAAIEETTRRTVGELDAVLGLLREEAPGAEGPALDTVDGLISRSGVPVAFTAEGELSAVPAAVSREAYRIVQEGLSNALRHAGSSPVSLWIALRGEELEITMENPLPSRAPVVRPGGGRGVRGIAERAALLGGAASAGPAGSVWRLRARLPLGGGSRGGAR